MDMPDCLLEEGESPAVKKKRRKYNYGWEGSVEVRFLSLTPRFVER